MSNTERRAPWLEEPARPRVAVRTTWALALAVLAMAAPACKRDEGPPMAPEGGDVSVDRSAVFDVSVNSDRSTKADASADDHGGEPQPGLDVATDETSVRPPDGAPASDADANDTDVREASTTDTGDLDVAYDSGEPAEASVADTKAEDAPDATPDTDATVPDDATPIFSKCYFTTYANEPPLVPPFIIEATLTNGAGSCQCNWPYNLVIHRVMCGSLPAGQGVMLHSLSSPCSVPAAAGDRVIVVSNGLYNCPFGAMTYGGVPRALSDWDAILAEQIAGHADGGAWKDVVDADSPD